MMYLKHTTRDQLEEAGDSFNNEQCWEIYIYIYIYIYKREREFYSGSSKLYVERRALLNIFVLATHYHFF